ncbi:NADP-dependent oxidoreductase domain-containing protein [Pholiota molesta]|nr:NADP-dependent oxidoreductase domain-containing protein [Pholiota molesta]
MSTTLPTRKIGTDDVSAIGFGLMGLSAFYGPIENDEDRFKVLDAAVAKGCTNWDTSDIYGDSEDLVGKWFKRTGKRDQIFLATKFGGTATGPIGTPEYVRSASEKSLKRLGIDTIDLYYIHRVDRSVPIEVGQPREHFWKYLTVLTTENYGRLVELVKEGKVRYIGISECSEATLRRAHAVHPIAALQIEYSPFFLDIEDDKVGLLKACRELGVAKSFDDIPDDDWRKTIPKLPNILKLVDGLQELGKKHNATAGQVTLAWLLAQGDDIIPIPGTKKIKYLEENIDALKVQLSPEEVAQIREYPAPHMAGLLADTPPL